MSSAEAGRSAEQEESRQQAVDRPASPTCIESVSSRCPPSAGVGLAVQSAIAHDLGSAWTSPDISSRSTTRCPFRGARRRLAERVRLARTECGRDGADDGRAGASTASAMPIPWSTTLERTWKDGGRDRPTPGGSHDHEEPFFPVQHDRRRHRREHALARLDDVALTLDEVEVVGRPRLHREIVHLVVEQDPVPSTTILLPYHVFRVVVTEVAPPLSSTIE